MSKSLYLIDGHAQIFRAYYAPFRELTSPQGEPTRATYVFTQMLLGLIRDRKPDYLAMPIDTSDETTFRREMYPDYKANRDAPPEDLEPQVDRIVEIVKTAGIPVLRVPGFEADDVIATIAEQLADEDVEIFLVSKDKDLYQLFSPKVKMYDPGKGEVFDTAALLEKSGFSPKQSVEIQTLTGDTVDNIPGVKGVGPKTAVKLIAKYGSARAVIDHADELTPKQRDNVLAFAPNLELTRKLITLRRDTPIDFDLESARFTELEAGKLRPIFESLGFNRLLDALEETTEPSGGQEQGGAKPAVPSSALDKGGYQLVDSPEAFHGFVEKLKAQQIFAFDTETTSLSARQARLVGLSFCWRASEAYYLPIRASMGRVLDETMVVDALRPIFEDAGVRKVGQNIKYDLLVLRGAGIKTRGVHFDTMLASFLLDPLRRSHSMDFLSQELLGHRPIPISDLIGKGKKQITIDQVTTDQVCDYAAEDADITWRLYEILSRQLSESPFVSLFEETEMPLVSVLVNMEFEGVALNPDFLAAMTNTMADRMAELTRRIHAEAGREFNIDSPKQLSEVLFDEIGLRVVRKTKTGRSTDAETLATLAFEQDNPIPKRVLEYRELAKLKNTYVDTLPDMMHPETGRIHTSFNQTGAVTGRLSSNDPNLQNIPVRTEMGREIRKAFVPGDPANVLLTADYSQIELRMMAHFSQDDALLEAFRQEQDVHAFVAAQVFGVDIDEVTKEQRSQAKAVNFGIIYGQTPFGLARTTGMAVNEAKMFIDMYFMRYPGVRFFIDKCIDRARREGYAATILGRRRPIPELRSRNRQQVALGQRLAVNTVLQGSAADLIKRAMIGIDRRVHEEKRPSRMLIQVHDELVFETPEASVEDEAAFIREEMVHALPLDVPIAVDVAWGRNWLEGK